MNYSDGTSETMPVVSGPEGVSDWSGGGNGVVRGWIGPINDNLRQGSLSELIWENPHPGKVIETIDFLSEESPHGAPFLVAITLEEDK